MDVICYSIGCPKCKVLEMKLKQANIPFNIISDIEIMKEKGFKESPKLEVDGIVMGYKEAVEWIKENASE